MLNFENTNQVNAKLNLDKLNDKQKEAVLHTEGPLLVLAGAGSGKTTVLVNRIAYIIEQKLCSPSNILVITFTNKAAGELKNRLINMLDQKAEYIWASTFHLACIKILRLHIKELGYSGNFNIYDRNDQTSIVKECMKRLEINDKVFPAKTIINEISRAKDSLTNSEEYLIQNSSDFRKLTIGQVYKLYTETLKKNDALDFDDIIMNTVLLFEKNPDILGKYREKFKYIMVDEYQDTNHAQYRLVSMLAHKHKNICVVGDDDQSIYKFRGADLSNILNFEHEFKDTKIIKLEQNYRSTKNILKSANSLVANNKGRRSKNLWTDNHEGDLIFLSNYKNEYAEADFVASEILRITSNLGQENEFRLNDIAVFYRTNFQSRVLEEALLKQSIPHKIIKGFRFYERKEVKDIVAYLRLITNHNDNVSLKRIINEPKRGIGNVTIQKIENLANEYQVSMYELVKNSSNYLELQKNMHIFSDFVSVIDKLSLNIETENVAEFIRDMIDETGYINAIQNETESEFDPKVVSKKQNIEEFLSLAKNYEWRAFQKDETPSIIGLLEHISLMSDADNYEESEDTVSLMTIHSAKGLEFPIVFMTGMEEGLFPSGQSFGNIDEIEEERRLCYVAVTRAKQKLYFTYAKQRSIFQKSSYNEQSRFIEEIPEECINDLSVDLNKNRYSNNEYDAFSSYSKKSTRTSNNFSLFDNYGFSMTISDIKRESKTINLEIGNRVNHKKYGEGIILEITRNVQSDDIIEIQFDSGESKLISASYLEVK